MESWLQAPIVQPMKAPDLPQIFPAQTAAPQGAVNQSNISIGPNDATAVASATGGSMMPPLAPNYPLNTSNQMPPVAPQFSMVAQPGVFNPYAYMPMGGGGGGGGYMQPPQDGGLQPIYSTPAGPPTPGSSAISGIGDGTGVQSFGGLSASPDPALMQPIYSVPAGPPNPGPYSLPGYAPPMTPQLDPSAGYSNPMPPYTQIGNGLFPDPGMPSNPVFPGDAGAWIGGE